MNWAHIGQGVNDALAILLVVRLLLLRLHSVYRIFCLYILVQVIGSWIAFIDDFVPAHHQIDYRLTWIPLQVVVWILSLWMVYAFLKGVLRSLPGILKFSRKLLNVIFLAAIGLALWSAAAEYSSSNALRFVTPLGKIVGRMFILDRAICSAACMSILAIFAFVLWFPVSMPKNLAMFSVGFAVYFAATAASLLTWSLFSGSSLRLVDNATIFILSACYAYWAIFLTAEGESLPVRIGHSWRPLEQDRLMDQLEAMNASLMRSARR